MSRRKLKALTFSDYLINLVLSALGFIALSWIFNFSLGPFIYSIIFTVSLFLFMYSRGTLAAKIDLRENKTPMTNALELISPLAITLLLIILVYSLIHYNIIPVGEIVIRSAVTESGEIVQLLFKDVASVVIRVLFLNVTGFMTNGLTNPLILLISPAAAVLGAFTGYYLGKRKIYVLEVLVKAKDFISRKFNE